MRKTDNPQSTRRFFRASSRVYQMNGAWYIASREGDLGPFATARMADREAQRLLADRRALAGFQQSRESRVDLLAPRRAKANAAVRARLTGAESEAEVDARLKEELAAFARTRGRAKGVPALAVESR